jgi:glycosyltransferase involved in cell wall biosynthesis
VGRLVLVTSYRSTSLRKVAEDIARVARARGFTEVVTRLYPAYEPSLFEGADLVVTVMTFDPAWVTPFAVLHREVVNAGVRAVFYTTVEGRVVRMHGDHWLYRDVEPVANSYYTASKLREAGARVVGVVHHGVDVEEVRSFSYMRDEVRSKVGVSGSEPLVGYLAAGYLRKGHSLFAKAINYLSKSSSIRVVVVTDEKGRRCYDEAPDAIVLDWFGKMTKDWVYGFYHALDAYVHASLAEGFGLPVLEALAAGKPVVHPDYDPLSEITTPSTSVRIPVTSVEYRSEGGAIEYELHYYNPQELANAVARAVSLVRDRKGAIERACVRRAKQFDMHELYSKLLSLGATRAPPPQPPRR